MVGGGKKFDRPPFVLLLKSPYWGDYEVEGEVLWLARCHRRWDIRPSSRKNSSELKEKQQRTVNRAYK
jgi:hypothetical protein